MNDLHVRDLIVRYGEAVAVDGVTFSVTSPSVVAVVGSNGAGKSTLLKAISGLVKIGSGDVILDGESIDDVPAFERARAGLVHVPEGRGLIPNLSVIETLVAASDFQGAKAERGPRLERVFTIFPRLRERRRQLAGTLSGGEQQMLAIARGIMTGPRVLLLDEPSLGLSPKLAREMLMAVKSVQQEGQLAVILVEQNVKLALRVANDLLVMDSGRIVLNGKPEELEDDPRLVQAYLGGLASE